MKKRLRIILSIGSAILLLLLIVGIAAIAKTGSDRAKGIYPAISNASELYKTAVDTVNGMNDLAVTISHSKETSIGGESFHETSTQTIRYSGLTTENASCIMEETLLIGDQSTTITEQYWNGIGYFTVDGIPFSGTITQAQYLDRYIPSAPLGTVLYDSITGVDTGDIIVITFSQPTAPEIWISEPNAVLLSAEGTAEINKEGQLCRSTYNVSYSLNGAYIKHDITVALSYDTVTEVTPPAKPEAYTRISYLDGPRMLEAACGYLLSSENITSNLTSKLSCEAFGDVREESITVNTAGGESWAARLDTDVTLTNSSRAGDISRLTKTELFTKGKYTVSTDGSEPTEDPQIDAQTVQTWCNDILVGTVMLPQYLSEAVVFETDSTLRITYSANQEFVQLISANTCQTLYQEPELLEELAQAHTTDDLEAYLELDKYTGLPVAAGINYNGTYTISGIPYALTSRSHQTYQVLSRTAYDAIYEKTGA